MDKYIFDESNNLWYKLVGDYNFPCLTVPAEEAQSVGVWGQRSLKKYRPALYDALLLSGKLNSYLAEIDQKANAMFSRLVEQMAQRQGVTEQLKISDQMTWVGRMNNIRKVVEEIVHGEFVLP